MTESTTDRAPNGNGHIPAWMQTVDEDTFYNTESTGEAGSGPSVPSSSEAPTDPSANDASSGSSEGSGTSSLDEDLALSMVEPSNIPKPHPDLQPTPVGHVRTDLDRQLEKAVSVLATRYATAISKSLVLEYALQRTLVNLRQDGQDSELVRWMDSVLPHS